MEILSKDKRIMVAMELLLDSPWSSSDGRTFDWDLVREGFWPVRVQPSTRCRFSCDHKRIGGVLSLTNLCIGLKAGWDFDVAVTANILYAICTYMRSGRAC